ncbi:MAG: amidohydrolase [Fibrobacterota bacterium]
MRIIDSINQAIAKTNGLLLLNGRIVSLDEKKPFAGALYIRDGRIASLGDEKTIRASVPAHTPVLDCQSGMVIPGLIEGHAHLLKLGYTMARLPLARAKTFDDITAMVRDAVKKARPGEWISGRGWHQENWISPPEPGENGYPLHDALTQAAPDNPVLLVHSTGHSLLANRCAMEKAGVTPSTPVPPGGRIQKRASGELTGLFFETAMPLIQNVMDADRAKRPAAEAEVEERRALHAALRLCLENGITVFHDAGIPFRQLETLAAMDRADALNITLYAMVGEDNAGLRKSLKAWQGFHGNRLIVRAIKKTMDGAMGAHTGWLLEPYTDRPDSIGVPVIPPAELLEAAQIAYDHGCQLCTHAIGDRANREALDVYEAFLKQHPDAARLRFRIEHAQHLHPADISRFSQLGVTVMAQGAFVPEDFPWIVKRLGEKRCAEGAFVYRSLLNHGTRLGASTDAPVIDINPMKNIHAMVARTGPHGEPFYPEQRYTRLEALKAYTLDNAYAGFMEDERGTLSPGKRADITVLSKDILAVPEEEIPLAHPILTLVDGVVQYRK